MQVRRRCGIKTGVSFFASAHASSALCQGDPSKAARWGSALYLGGVPAGSASYGARPITWRNLKEYASYGGMGDMGSHIIDMLFWFVGADATAVTAVTRAGA